jgi:septal ring factor EnvC (AmiA/AmiB activator)
MIHDQIVQEDKAIQEELEKEVTRLDQREKELIQKNGRIKQQLASAIPKQLN